MVGTVTLNENSYKLKQKEIAMINPDTVSAVEVNIGNLFVKFKDHGGLVNPSCSVTVVCQETEQCFYRMKAVLCDRLPQATKLPMIISRAVLAEVGCTTM